MAETEGLTSELARKDLGFPAKPHQGLRENLDLAKIANQQVNQVKNDASVEPIDHSANTEVKMTEQNPLPISEAEAKSTVSTEDAAYDKERADAFAQGIVNKLRFFNHNVGDKFAMARQSFEVMSELASSVSYIMSQSENLKQQFWASLDTALSAAKLDVSQLKQEYERQHSYEGVYSKKNQENLTQHAQNRAALEILTIGLQTRMSKPLESEKINKAPSKPDLLTAIDTAPSSSASLADTAHTRASVKEELFGPSSPEAQTESQKLMKLFETKLKPELQEKLGQLGFVDAQIRVVGSVVEGRATRLSDIDIIIEGKDGVPLAQLADEAQFKQQVAPHFFDMVKGNKVPIDLFFIYSPTEQWQVHYQKNYGLEESGTFYILNPKIPNPK